ncbi:MAG: 50S ribosomal protein L35 [Opitutales bacterium]|nr:50S ribosomal protein L35 [Opitutales bacterium]MCH8476028.1 50S ribosomal protein L35 [Opitutales bacterium]MCH8539984.1 50S ribosomal protein L35 [Opitutales bacterium]
MQKTKKSIAKRFKKTGTGKLLRRSPGMRHILAKKSRKRRRTLTQDKAVAKGDAKRISPALPFGC